MYIKLTLVTLIVILFVVVALSYSVNKEGFENISNGYYKSLSKDLASAVNTVAPDIPATSTPASATATIVAPASVTPSATANIVPQTPSATANIVPPSSTPERTDVVPEVSISGSGYDAMSLQQRMELLKDIQKVVRNEILAHRSTTPIISGETRKSKDTDSTAQGQEYESSCHKDTEYRCPKNPDGTCPPMPDMSQYIKKDAIPCWNCALDY